jgi:phospholipid/cholesterol/gamma-HCH transport system permease protein
MADPKRDNAVIRTFKELVFVLGEQFKFVVETMRGLPSAYRYRRDLMEQMYLIGAQSVIITSLAGLFMGIIFSIEAGHRLETFGAKMLIGRTTSLGLIRELGPVVCGLMLAARTGAKNASELGSMTVSGQIDALRAFGTNPIEKLVVPRLLAAMIMFLPLTVFADFVGLYGGMLVSDQWLHVNQPYFWQSAIGGLKIKDLFIGFIKPVVFGFSISEISCYYGLATTGGTVGVGRAAVNAVVVAATMVLFTDFILTKVVWAVM